MREGQRSKLFWRARCSFIRTIAQQAIAFHPHRDGGMWEALRDAAEYWEREQLAQLW